MKMDLGLEEFLSYCQMQRRAVKTVQSYEQALRMFAMYLKGEHEMFSFKDVKERHMTAYIAYLQERGKYTVTVNPNSLKKNFPENRTDYKEGMSSITINNYLRNLKVFFNYLVGIGYIRSSPLKRIKPLPVEEQRIEYISDGDFKRLLQSLNIATFPEYRDSVIIQLLYDTGMRIGETLASKAENLNLQSCSLFLPAEITKGKKSRTVFFSKQTAQALRHWLKYKDRYRDSDFIFCTNKGKSLEIRVFETNFRKYCGRLGIKDIHPHSLRHSFARSFLMHGGNIYTLSRLMGHSSVQVTEQAYLDLTEKDLGKMYFANSPIANL